MTNRARANELRESKLTDGSIDQLCLLRRGVGS